MSRIKLKWTSAVKLWSSFLRCKETKHMTSSSAISVQLTGKQRQPSGGLRRTRSLLYSILHNLWGVVPIIILITSAPLVSAVSIAAVSVGSSNGSLGNVASAHFVSKMQSNYNLPGHFQQSNGVPFHKGNDTKWEDRKTTLHLPQVGHVVVETTHKQRWNSDEPEIDVDAKGKRQERMGDTRVMSNQDVATLALAVDNSSSVAIANINSSFNTVSVTIGASAFPSNYNRYDSANRYNPHYDRYN